MAMDPPPAIGQASLLSIARFIETNKKPSCGCLRHDESTLSAAAVSAENVRFHPTRRSECSRDRWQLNAAMLSRPADLSALVTLSQHKPAVRPLAPGTHVCPELAKTTGQV